MIISCSSNDYNTEFLDQNNDEEEENEFAEIDYGLAEYGITYQGIDRDFSIYIPESYTHDSPSSMMFVFHGFGGSNDMIMYYSDFNSISERENFIVVYPQGSSFWGYPHWNVGGWTNTSSADDIGFIDFLIELISQEYNLNQNRIYATGMSNGGFFSFLLACQLSQKIAAVASVTGSGTTGVGQLSFAEVSGGTSWQAVTTTNATMAAGEGYFVNTTSGAITMTLPGSASQGDEVSIIDYAGTFDTNNLTVGRNSHNIQGSAADLTVSTERAGFTLVYVDSTQGWLLKDK